MIILLDDLSRHVYKKLKADEDALARIYLVIEYKKKLVAVHMDMWMACNESKINDADAVYAQKYNLEVEISKLEKEAEVIRKRVISHVSS